MDLTWLQSSLTLLFPNECLICRAPAHTALCQRCHNTIDEDAKALQKRCFLCQMSTGDRLNALCPSCSRSATPHLDGLMAYSYYHSPLKELITMMKYQKNPAAARVVAELIAPHLTALLSLLPQPLTLLPMPMDPLRYALRGYHPLYFILQQILGERAPNISPKWVKKSPRYQRQNRLSRHERLQNLQGAFTVTEPPSKTVLIFEDVYTTGTTINTLSQSLRQAGVEELYSFVIAVVPPPDRRAMR